MNAKFMMRTVTMLCFFIVCSGMVSIFALDYRISMITGKWLSSITPVLIRAEIDGKGVLICLPKIEFLSEVNYDELKKRIKESIEPQEAIFHIYCDNLNKPIKSGEVMFAADVFLKARKMTYFTALRDWGYRMKISRQAPFEDHIYIQQVQSQGLIAMSAEISSSDKSVGKQKHRSDSSNVGNSGSMSIAHLLPTGYLPPEVRRMKKELDKKLKEIKTRPFKTEEIIIEPVRWAAGRMGILKADGTATQCVIEGQSASVKLPVPNNNEWFKPELAAALASQPCEFIIRRDITGREKKIGDNIILADIYFTETGQTWNDWLSANGISLPQQVEDSTFATAPIKLSKLVVDGIWKSLKAPALCEIELNGERPAGLAAVEIFRITPPELPPNGFKKFSTYLANLISPRSPVNVTLLLLPDGTFYEEMGQKRAHRIYFPQKQVTLTMLMESAAKALKSN